jgi:hypothetical protein
MTKSSENIPQHIAIILDGNRRWAKANFKARAKNRRKNFYRLRFFHGKLEPHPGRGRLSDGIAD